MGPQEDERRAFRRVQPQKVRVEEARDEGGAGSDGGRGMFVGMDFGRDKSETVIHESRRGKLVARYDLPDDPHLRSCRDWFNEEFNKRLSKFFAKRVKEIEAEKYSQAKEEKRSE
jgi:hypothetical protein